MLVPLYKAAYMAITLHWARKIFSRLSFGKIPGTQLNYGETILMAEVNGTRRILAVMDSNNVNLTQWMEVILNRIMEDMHLTACFVRTRQIDRWKPSNIPLPLPRGSLVHRYMENLLAAFDMLPLRLVLE